MKLRSGVYIVPTNHWYIERTVWLIAGIVLLIATTLAAFVQPLWALLIIATGVSSVTVALTRFCVVGNILKRAGFASRLESGDASSKWYFMQTDRWYLERRIYLAVGINISIASVLSIAYSPWWLAFTAFVGVAMVWFSVTGFCIMANSLTGWVPNRAWHRRPTALLAASLPSERRRTVELLRWRAPARKEIHPRQWARRQSMAAFDGPGRSTDAWQLISG